VEASNAGKERVNSQSGLWVPLLLCVGGQGGGVEGEKDPILGTDPDFVVRLWFGLSFMGSVNIVLLVLDIQLVGGFS
jgi:hypothetical protein